MHSYLVNYAHIYLVHLGAWGAYYGFMAVKDNKHFTYWGLLKVSLFLAIFSSVAHNHYMQFLK